ncbi:MAG: tyrosine-type recombinase/integrase [Acidobacteria bacterium]|nr:tyrosine-type recombinase/integrase [Acidobacteriota bacterium]
MKTMTAARAKALREPGKYRAEQTLYLRVRPSGRKSWVQRLTIHGKRRDIGLGPFDLVTLAEARIMAWENRRAVFEGRDPLAERRRAKAPTFREAAARTLEGLRSQWRNGKHAAQWVTTLETYAFPTLGDQRVDSIRGEDVLRVLLPIWTTKAETARRVRQRIRTVLSWAQAHGFTSGNVAGEGIDGALPKGNVHKTHFRALPYQEVGEALAMVDASPASPAARLCFRFLVLTAARSGEARGARWSEMDKEAREWRIPGERTKTGAPHRVPLSAEAMAALERARALDDRGGLVFPGRQRGRELSNMTLTKILRDNGLADRATVHGFRSAFRDWCAETGAPREVAEAALAHTVGGVEGAYFRSDLFERRRALMDEWAAFLDRSDSRSHAA